MFQVKMLSTYCGLSNFAACSMRHLQLSSMMSNACSMLSSSIACSACTEEDCVSAAALEEYCAEIGVFRGRDRRSVREGEHGGGGRARGAGRHHRGRSTCEQGGGAWKWRGGIRRAGGASSPSRSALRSSCGRSPWLVDHRYLRAGFCLMNRNGNRKEGGDDLLVVLI